MEDALGEALGKAGLEWDEDVAPALGPTVALVLPGKSSDPVLLTQPEDEAKLDALSRRATRILSPERSRAGRRSPRTRQRSPRTSAPSAASSSSGQAAFAEAMAELPEDALARVYVRGDALDLAGLGQSIAGLGGGGLASPGTLDLGTLAAAVVAEDEGCGWSARRSRNVCRDRSRRRSSATYRTTRCSPRRSRVESSRRTNFARRLADSGPLLEGLSASSASRSKRSSPCWRVRASVSPTRHAPIPEVTLVLEQTDARQPATLKTPAGARRGVEGTACDGDGGWRQVTRLTVGPVSLASAATRQSLRDDGPGGIAAFLAGNAKLVDGADFTGAMDRVGYDGSTSGLVYADVDALVPLLEGLAGLAGGIIDGVGRRWKAPSPTALSPWATTAPPKRRYRSSSKASSPFAARRPRERSGAHGPT